MNTATDELCKASRYVAADTAQRSATQQNCAARHQTSVSRRSMTIGFSDELLGQDTRTPPPIPGYGSLPAGRTLPSALCETFL